MDVKCVFKIKNFKVSSRATLRCLAGRLRPVGYTLPRSLIEDVNKHVLCLAESKYLVRLLVFLVYLQYCLFTSNLTYSH